ncbi:MAG: PTS fructose transporter subunit IIABC [Brevinemataceae bacterium]
MEHLFSPDLILTNIACNDKLSLLKEASQQLFKHQYINNTDSFLKALLEREKHGTLIDENIAIPHAKTNSVDKAGVVIIRTASPIIWDEKTKETAQLFFVIAMPQKEHNLHVELISIISNVLQNQDNLNILMSSDNLQEIYHLLNQKPSVSNDSISSEPPKIIAITSCPTGIAHTYMAADALKKAATAKSISIRVETHGSDGPKNILSSEDINYAQTVIIASDRELDLSRFEGKKVIFESAGYTVRHAENVIQKALDPNIPIYRTSDNSNSGSKGIYSQLMTGVSYMLPFVVGGGILIAIGFMFGITSHDPSAPDYNPIAQFLHTLGGSGAFALMIPILAGYIGFAIAERPALMPAMTGGLLAANNGGGFLGGLIAGFIGGYSIVLLKKFFSFLPKNLEGLKPVLFYPVFGLLLTGIVLMPVLTHISDLNNSISDFLNSLNNTNLILLGALLGGMMAVDLGGPVNKAAFTFGIAATAAGNYFPHAAVMAGGMTPPLGVALATTLFKKYFSKTEQEAGIACYALGASFITEGVIPFAASNPLIILPSCILGSMLAGALSMLFQCQLPAPHGGIFVFPLITNVWLYIVAIVAGSLLTALLIGILMKKEKNKKHAQSLNV